MNPIDNIKYPQFINIDEERKSKYLEPLTRDPASSFFGSEEGEVYCLAVALGYKNKHPIKTNKIKNVRLYSNLDPKYKLLFRIIALNVENFNYEIIEDGTRVLKLIEEYANGGIQILYDKVFGNGADFSIKDELWQEIKDLKIK